METDFCGPSLPPRFGQSAQSEHGSEDSYHHSEHLEQPERVCSSRARKHSDKRSTKFGQNTFHSLHLQRRISPLSPSKSLLSPKGLLMSKKKQQNNPDPVFYREVDMSDLPSQYAEEVQTFRHTLDFPDPRETMPRSSTTVLGLDDEKGFLASNLPEGKYIKPLLQQQNGTRWDSLVLRTNYISLIQILPRSVFLLSRLGPLWARFPYKF